MLLWLLLIAVAELSLRALGYSSVSASLGNYQFDSELGWVIRPGQRVYRATWAYAHFVRYGKNGQAIPDREEGQPRTGTPLTALIGDSFTEGFYVPYEQSFAHQLALHFSESSVWNLGVAGYSPEQYLLSARRNLKGLKPKRVLVFFYPYNDVPYVDVPSLYGLYSKPVLSPDLSRVLNSPLPPPPPPAYPQKLPALLTVNLPWLGKLLRIKTPPLPEDALDTAELAPPKLERALDILDAIRRETPTSCNVVIYVPAYEEFATGLLTRNHALFQEACRKRKLDCFWPEDFTAEKNWRSLYYELDNQRHFNAAGSLLFSKSVTRALDSRAPCAP